ncbi:MAG: L-aspartate oxidase, partial [Dictyoglomus turgidum]
TSAFYSPENYKVGLFTKDRLEESSTYYAQGGIAVALSKDDSPKLHYEDTLKAGADFNEENIVKIVVEEGIERIKDLINIGVNFDKSNGLEFTKEAAHSRRRILHAHGDSTGLEIAKTLILVIKNKENISIFENYFLVDLIKEKNKVVGGIFLNDKNELEIVYSKYTILATGGAGQIYLCTTNPKTSTGDGLAIAYRAGARLMDLEFYQFHPTALKVDLPQRFLISEAVRGEGGILKNYYGERFMLNYHPQGELAPRDIVTRAIYLEMLETERDIFLDFRPIGERKIKRRFPNILKTCKEHGFDITKEPIPVEPAAHYFMGGIETDEWGRTSVKNLYACGEVACTGLHGANRLASNSLLEGLVFGKRCIQAICQDEPSYSKSFKIEKLEERKISLSFDKKELKKLMWENVGILRMGEKLERALKILEEWVREVDRFILDKEFLELKNMTLVSYLITKSALLREESRGAHFRIDFPITKKEWRKHIIWEKEKEVIYRDVNSPPSFKENS